MIREKRKIGSGLYLVVDPSIDEDVLLRKLNIVLKEEIVALQVWDNFRADSLVGELLEKICDLGHAHDIPVLINNKWEYLLKTSLDGVHFDAPVAMDDIRTQIKIPFISGVTCGNDLGVVQWAETNRFDYISFCSMFPSTTANSCELVDFTSVRRAREITRMPIFLAGGIRPENVDALNELDYSGIAVVSGVMSSDAPDKAIRNYRKHLKTRL